MVSVQKSPTVSYVVLPEGTRRGCVFGVREPGAPVPPKPRLLDRVRAAVRIRHDSRRTGKAYVAWILRDILFHGMRHPAEMGAPEVARFLSSLAVDRKVAASTQNQALSALLFLYRAVLGSVIGSDILQLLPRYTVPHISRPNYSQAHVPPVWKGGSCGRG